MTIPDRDIAPGHAPKLSRRPCGLGANNRTRYGINIACECGWKGYSNEAPSKGGLASVRYLYREHLAAKPAEPAP